jgi:hypothetical protein
MHPPSYSGTWHRVLLLLVLAGFSLVPSVSAQKVKVEYDKKNDFSRFKTYYWGRRNDEYLRPILATMVMGSVEYNLQQKGLKKVESGGDLVIEGYGSIDTEMSVIGVPDLYYFPPVYGAPWWGQPYLIPGTSTATILKKGVLVIDLADPKTKTLQWRGIATAKFDSTQKEKSLQVMEKSIAKMFKDYPGRPTQ